MGSEPLSWRRETRRADRWTWRIHQAIPKVVRVLFHVHQVFEAALLGAGVDRFELGRDGRAGQDAIDLPLGALKVPAQTSRTLTLRELGRALPRQAIGAIGPSAFEGCAVSAGLRA